MVATADGDLLLVNYNGELLERIESSPTGHRILSMTTFQRGVIVGGENGKIWIYESVQVEGQCPLRLLHFNDKITLTTEGEKAIAESDQEKKACITSLAVNKSEDCLYLMTDTKQLMHVNNINLDGSENDRFMFQYVSNAFHSGEIRGLDVCLRKQLIVTCSDTMINIWNY